MLLVKQTLEYIFTRKEVYLKAFPVILQAGKMQWEYRPEICAACKKTEIKSSSYSCFPISVRAIVLFVAEFGMDVQIQEAGLYLIEGHFKT